MDPDLCRLDGLRAGSSELESHYIDELIADRVSRRQFIRSASTIGMSVPLMGVILAACGGTNNSPSRSPSTGASRATPTKGGTLRIAVTGPTAAVNPLTVADSGGAMMLAQVGEFLLFHNNLKDVLQPQLAVSYRPNADGTIWTFKLRPGVKFHTGAVMNADDVVYTFKQLSDPKNASNALATFAGVLSPAGVRKVDPLTVEFHLESPIGNFPYLVSSDTFNAIIVPNNTDFANWQKTFVGTGPFKFRSYAQNVNARFAANPDYWGVKPLLDATQFTLYSDQPPQFLALQGGQVDVVPGFVPQGAEAILNSSNYTIIKLSSSSHRELSMRNDMVPFTDPRVRQAVALTLDRPSMVKALLDGYGEVGNDSPFAPVFASTDSHVSQRTEDLPRAKQLLAAAGHPNGFTAHLFTEQDQEMAGLAQAIKAEAAKASININLTVEPTASYYGKATYGNSDWLDGQMSLVDYGGRGVPNVVLESALTSNGPWNAARFKNPRYDALVKQYVASVDLQTQKQIAGKIETLLLAETPIIVPYFLDELTATTTNVHGVSPTATAQLFLGQAYIS
jgi:peptide/nickel transport system substrate-binding protein